jgi:hypothetical protein
MALCSSYNSHVFRVSALFISSTSVVCLSPASASVGGSVALEVSVDGGFTWTADRIRFNYSPKAVFLSVNPSRGPAAGGSTVTISGNAFVNSL